MSYPVPPAGHSHLYLPIALLGLLIAAIHFWGLDLKWATLLYESQGGRWALRDHWLVSTTLHDGGRRLAGGLLLAVWAAAGASLIHPSLRRSRGALLYLALVLPLAPLLVGALKATLPVHCPWDLSLFGGRWSYEGGWWGALGKWDIAASGCFPAGHASGGYTFVSSYFALREARPRWRFVGLGFGLLLGTTFGLAQQLRGAHFLSHDLWALGISWTLAVIGYTVWCRLRARQASLLMPSG